MPEYHPLVEVCVVEGRHVLQLWAAGGQNRPYQAPKSLAEKGKRTSEYAYFIRRHSSTVEVKRNSSDWNELMELAAKVPFDDRVNHRAKVDDLEMELVTQHLKMAGSGLLAQIKASSPLEIFQKMRLVDGPPEFLRPRNAGLEPIQIGRRLKPQQCLKTTFVASELAIVSATLSLRREASFHCCGFSRRPIWIGS